MTAIPTPARWCARLGGLVFAAALAACGGGSEAPGRAAAPTATATAAIATASAARAAAPAAVAATTAAGTSTLIAGFFAYAERAYPLTFPGSPETQTAGGYTYRYYAATGNYLGSDGTAIYLLGPAAGSTTTPVRVMSLTEFCDAQPGDCGTLDTRSSQIQGLARQWLVYTPWAVRAGAAVPVVWVVHGTSGSGPDFFQQTGWREKANAEGLIAVFPSALRHCYFDPDPHTDPDTDGVGQVKTLTKWAAGKLGSPDMPLCTPQQRELITPAGRAATDHPLADDIAFFTEMVRVIKAEYPADAQRLYATGFSNGGQMTARLASEMSGTFAAIATSGAGAAVQAPAPRPLSVLLTVGSADHKFTSDLGLPPMPVDIDIGAEPAFTERFVTHYASILGLTTTPYTWTTGPLNTYGSGRNQNTSQYLYAGSRIGAGNSLRVVIVEGQDHTYPNYLVDVIWDFFEPRALQ